MSEIAFFLWWCAASVVVAVGWANLRYMGAPWRFPTDRNIDKHWRDRW